MKEKDQKRILQTLWICMITILFIFSLLPVEPDITGFIVISVIFITAIMFLFTTFVLGYLLWTSDGECKK